MLKKKVIEVVAPSSAGDTTVNLVHDSKKAFESLGFEVRINDDLLDHKQVFHANEDAYRIRHMIETIFNPEINIIWCLRGGYGAAKVVNELLKITRTPLKKIFIGFSDITALHVFLSGEWGWKTIHGASFTQIAKGEINPLNIQLVVDVIKGKIDKLQMPELKHISGNYVQEISGEVVGGNLSLIQTSLGTSWQMKAEGKILLVEDVNERGYKVERMLVHLLQVGILQNVKALIYGDIIGGNELEGVNHVEYALQSFSKYVSFPIFQTKNFGHGKNNYPFILGTNGIIKKVGKEFVFEQACKNIFERLGSG